MKTQIESKYLDNISLIRVFAILMVVLGHSMIIYQYGWGTYTPAVKSGFFNAIKTYIDTFQMPLFIFVSGYVYYFCRMECGKYNNLIRFIYNKIKRLLLPFIFVALFYLVPIRIFVNYKPYNGYNLFQIIYKYILPGTDIGNLWYLIALFEIFIIFYLFEPLINKLGVKLSFIIMAFVNIISFAFPYIFQISNLMHYIIFFYLGYAIRKKIVINPLKIVKKTVLTITLLLSQFLFLLLAVNVSINNYVLNRLFSNSMYLLNNISATIFYFLILSFISNKYKGLNKNNILKFIDDKSYAIYLFHSPLIYILFTYTSIKNMNPFLAVPLIFVTIFNVSILITYVIEKTKVLKFIIGKPISPKNKRQKTAISN